jgi:3-oxoacyl-(acyl-carrier-protein) synthase
MPPILPPGSQPVSSALCRLLRDSPLVVTGVGCVSAAGHSADALWRATVAGESKAAWHELSAQPDAARYAACHAGDLGVRQPGLKAVRNSDRAVQLAWLAARQALKQACLETRQAGARVGVIVGSSRGPLGRLQQSFQRPAQTGRLVPSLAVDTTFASLSGTLAQGFNLLGPGGTISAACASGAVAIAQAAEQILLGNADAMLVGGTEAPLHPAIFAQLASARLLARHAEPGRSCRPFDTDRNGFVPGEGSAFLVLELAQTSARRGVPPLAELRGWATRLDPSGRAGIQADGEGLLTVMRRALELAELDPDQVDYINAHGTGTVQGDQAEARAVAAMFGARVPCSSTKPVTGHCMGATPALEAVIAIQALHHQIVPPTANCEQPDPSCSIDPLPLTARPARIRTVLSNSAGFWGYHAALVFSHIPVR